MPDVQLVSIVLAAAAALLNVILVPLVKSAARGEAVQMFKEHNEDSAAHAGLTIIAKTEIANAAHRAMEAAAAAVRSELATASFRKEVSDQFDKFNGEVRLLRNEIVDLRVSLAAIAVDKRSATARKIKGV